jgi:NAD(P)-dependent dehydrogenase (short-subunit alcohol dehydrogenase family)
MGWSGWTRSTTPTSYTRSLAIKLAPRGIRVNALAPAFVYLASGDSSYVSGEVLHVNGGTVVNG